MGLYFFVLGFFCLGIAIQHAVSAHRKLIAPLNSLIIWVILPALILTTIPDVSLSLALLFPVLIPWLLMLLSFMFAWGVGRYLQWPTELKLASAMMMGLGNTAFLGVPMIRILLGDEQLAGAVAYDQFGSFLLLCVVATASVAAFEPSSKLFDFKLIIKKILSFPPFVSMLLAFALPSTAVLGEGLGLLQALGSTIAPLAMLLVGLQFYIRIEASYRVPIAAVLFFRVLLAPVIVAVLALFFNVDINIANPTIMQSAMPPMVTGAILLMSANIMPKFVASVLGIGTLVCCAALPLLAYLLSSVNV